MNYLNFPEVTTDVSNQYFDSMNECNKFFEINFETYQGLTVLQLNARSIDSSKKFDKFKNVLMDVEFEVDIIVIGETYITYDTAGIHDMPSYIHYPSCRESFGGGLSVYVSFCLQHKFS